ncbi:MAG: NADH-quinone oxidoreductase subunit M [Blastopirellula sp.]|nr:NADH-quinone oxidoreductase subunit M [Blastopirellula sp.]
MDTPIIALSLIVFLPVLGAIVISFFPKGAEDGIRWTTLFFTGAVLVATLYVFFAQDSTKFEASRESMQQVFNQPWIPSFDIHYYMGIDGISFPLILLTGVVSMLAMGASWSIKKNVKSYCILFLLLETGMLGVFLALDFFLFYVFWEVMLLPMYFLIGVWGGERREYAAIKFFLYTLVGSVLMLIAILLLYFNSDVVKLYEVAQSDGAPSSLNWEALHIEGVTETDLEDELAERAADPTHMQPVHTFNMLALAAIGQHTDCFSRNLQWWCFLLLFIGFIIKVPSVPVHTWLPDAHVQAPTPISMILAGVLLKMGGYGIIRICYPICPFGGYDLMWFVCTLGVISMVYGAFAAMAQKDFKRLVAYSSVSHMGYVVLGLGVWSATAVNGWNPDYWNMGVKGAMFQMIGHGISSAGMFFAVGIVYDRVHHRRLDEFGGLYGKMPVYTALAMIVFFAGLGLPGLCGFIGEVFVVLSVYKFSIVLAVISASVVVLTAGYILWCVQRVYLGAEYKGPHEEELKPINIREGLIATTLAVLAIILGVFPHQTMLKYMDKTVDAQVQSLADWTQAHDSVLNADEDTATAAKAHGSDVVAVNATQD